jgi:hypothetical protein
MKPSDFMIGVINFLSILLPGTIATALLLHISPQVREVNAGLQHQDGFALVIGFAAAYFAGHLIFLAGSWLDPVYDFIRRRRDPYSGEYPKAASGLDALAIAVLCKRDLRLRPVPLGKGHQAFDVVDRLRRKALTKIEYDATNTFQWCRSILIQKSPAAHQDLEVHEADQKFFRSLVVLALIVAVGAAIALEWTIFAIALATAFASFVRYYNRRLKTVTLAYIHVLTMHRCGGLDFRALGDQPDQA